jgi:hypothetical protein
LVNKRAILLGAKMIITYKSGSALIEYNICDYHKSHSGETAYAGCGCSTTYKIVEKKRDPCDDCDPLYMPLCDKCLGA